MDKINAALAQARALVGQVADLLQGEPVLVIGNGAAVVVYIVARVSGAIPDQSWDQALGDAAKAIAVVNAALLAIRQYVTPASTSAE